MGGLPCFRILVGFAVAASDDQAAKTTSLGSAFLMLFVLK
jgi:hypothetical protein